MITTMKRLLIFIAALFILWAVFGFPMPAHSQIVKRAILATCRYRIDSGYDLPDPHCTPGQADPRLVADLSKAKHLVDGIEANICAKDFRTGPWRKVSESEKKTACEMYGITSGCPGPGYEVDHLISLELGGNDSVANLWPQPLTQARIKDHRVEDVLPKLICSGKMSMVDAQKCISSNWVACAARIATVTPMSKRKR